MPGKVSIYLNGKNADTDLQYGKLSVVLSSPRNFEQTVIERQPLFGFPGPTGAPGSPGGKVTYTAGQSTSSGRLVSALNNVASYFNPAGNYEPVGITQNAALSGDDVIVVVNGPITISGWGLTPGALYFALPNGEVTSNPALCTSRVQQIGIAEDSSTLILNIKQAIYI